MSGNEFTLPESLGHTSALEGLAITSQERNATLGKEALITKGEAEPLLLSRYPRSRFGRFGPKSAEGQIQVRTYCPPQAEVGSRFGHGDLARGSLKLVNQGQAQ